MGYTGYSPTHYINIVIYNGLSYGIMRCLMFLLAIFLKVFIHLLSLRKFSWNVVYTWLTHINPYQPSISSCPSFPVLGHGAPGIGIVFERKLQ